ncbi:hypothetical protein A8950_1913 [Dongia mobilis]|uniref:Uncharacterized protein n=2 Tax=Dongia mobilis TaxID=578943 RepID=A0A4R6WMJ7_9PROT|nr:hypothetical protein A8950_1913 [Dongia mobilis]
MPSDSSMPDSKMSDSEMPDNSRPVGGHQDMRPLERREGDRRKDSIHRAIVILMALDIVMGATIAAVGLGVLQDQAIALAGGGLALCGLVLLVFFELFGRRG